MCVCHRLLLGENFIPANKEQLIQLLLLSMEKRSVIKGKVRQIVVMELVKSGRN